VISLKQMVSNYENLRMEAVNKPGLEKNNNTNNFTNNRLRALRGFIRVF